MQKKNVIWIDIPENYTNNCDLIENNHLSEFYFEIVTDVETAFILIEEYEFTLLYVIIGDSFVEEFMTKYKEKSDNMNVVLANIILSNNREQHEGKFYFNDPFLNSGGVVSDFDQVFIYLKKDALNFYKALRTKPLETNQQVEKKPKTKASIKFSALQMEDKTGNTCNLALSINELILPIILGKLISKELISKQNTKNFINQIYKFGNPLLSTLANPSQEKIIDIPISILSKFYLKMFSISTEFYSKMNLYLKDNSFNNYSAYIYLLYNALLEKKNRII